MFSKRSLSDHLQLKLIMVLLLLFSFALGEVYRYILGLLSIIGLIMCIRYFNTLRSDPKIHLLLLLFLFIWIPMLIALVDAEYIRRSAAVTARFLIFPLAGIVLLYWILQPNMAKKLLWGTMGIVAFWTIDGLVQSVSGHDLLGLPSFGDGRLAGMFYPWPHLGVVLAIFLPVYLEGLYQLSLKFRWAWLLILPVLSIILLGGGRSSWMLTGVALCSYVIYYKLAGRPFAWLRGLLLGISCLFIAALTVWNVDWLSQRVNNTLGLFSGDYQLFSRATSERPPVWSTAWNMAGDHWFNGVGPRAFQSSYQQYSTAAGDPFINAPAGHPHLFVLEVAAETGLIGVIGYLVFLIFLVRQIASAIKSGHSHAVPWGLAAFVGAFPLSSTMSFYAYFSSCLIWTLVMIFVALSHQSTHNIPLMTERNHRSAETANE